MDHNYSDVRQCFTALRVASLYGNCEIETESGNFCTTFWHSSSLQVHIFFFRTNYLLTYISVSISVFVILVYDQYLPRLLKLINWSQFNIHCFLCSCFTPVLQENPSHLSYFSVCIWHIKSYHKCMVFYEELAFPQYRNLRQNVSKCIGRNEINSYRVYSI